MNTDTPDAGYTDPWSDPAKREAALRSAQDGRQLRITRGSHVVTKRIDWLVEHWIPRGSLTLLAGREGLGKSTLACWWAAWLTRQGKTVVYIHTEDSREHTVVPRLKAAGAELDNVLFIDVATETTDTGTVTLPLDNQRLEDLVVAEKVAFIVLDAATSAMASQLSGKDDRQVRQFLEPLAQLAARQDIVILGLVHFGKRDGADTGKLILGSIAWSQVARSVLSVAHDAEQDHLVVTNTKGNLATKVLSKACRVISKQVQLDDGAAEVGVIEWLGEVDTDARDVLAGDEQRDDSASASVDVAVDWLRNYLEADGPHILSAEVKRRSKAADISERTLQRARKKLGVVVTYTDEKPSRSQWSLPSQGAVVVDGEVVPTAPYARERGTASNLGTTPGQEDMPGSEVAAYPQDTGGCANPEFMAQPPVQPAADTAVIGQWKGSGDPVTTPRNRMCTRCYVVLAAANQTELCEDCADGENPARPTKPETARQLRVVHSEAKQREKDRRQQWTSPTVKKQNGTES